MNNVSLDQTFFEMQNDIQLLLINVGFLNFYRMLLNPWQTLKHIFSNLPEENLGQSFTIFKYFKIELSTYLMYTIVRSKWVLSVAHINTLFSFKILFNECAVNLVITRFSNETNERNEFVKKRNRKQAIASVLKVGQMSPKRLLFA